MNVASERVTLKIPRLLYERLQEVIQGTGFRSVNAFVVHVLRDLVAEARDPSTALSPREVDRIRERLRNLGYLYATRSEKDTERPWVGLSGLVGWYRGVRDVLS